MLLYTLAIASGEFAALKMRAYGQPIVPRTTGYNKRAFSTGAFTLTPVSLVSLAKRKIKEWSVLGLVLRK